MQVIIEITEANDMFKISAVQMNGAPIGFPDEYCQYVHHPMQIARAVRWVRDDVTRNEYVLDIRVNNKTALEL